MTPAIQAGLQQNALTDPRYQGHPAVPDDFRDVSTEWFVESRTIHGAGTFDFLHKHRNRPKRSGAPRR